MRARARGPKRATSDNGPIIGRSDPYDTQGSGAKSRGTRSAECRDSHPLSERACIPRDGRDVRGSTCPRGSADANSRRGLLASQQCAAMACEFPIEPELVRHGGATGHPARREATGPARATPPGWTVCGASDGPVALRESHGAASERARRVLGRRVVKARGVPARSGAESRRPAGRAEVVHRLLRRWSCKRCDAAAPSAMNGVVKIRPSARPGRRGGSGRSS